MRHTYSGSLIYGNIRDVLLNLPSEYWKQNFLPWDHSSMVCEVTLWLDFRRLPGTPSNLLSLLRQSPDQKWEAGRLWTAPEEDNGHSHQEVPPHPQELERSHRSGRPPHCFCGHCHGPWHTERLQQQLPRDPDLPIHLRDLWSDSLLRVSHFLTRLFPRLFQSLCLREEKASSPFC